MTWVLVFWHNVWNSPPAGRGLSFQQDGAPPHMQARKWLDAISLDHRPIGQIAVCTMHLGDFSIFFPISSVVSGGWPCKRSPKVALQPYNTIPTIGMYIPVPYQPFNHRWHRGGRTFFSRTQIQPTKPKRPRSRWLRTTHGHALPDMWSPSSHDLNPTDYYVWGVFEEDTNKGPDDTKQPLTDAIVHVTGIMQEAPLICACSPFCSHMGVTVGAEGRFIE